MATLFLTCINCGTNRVINASWNSGKVNCTECGQGVFSEIVLKQYSDSGDVVDAVIEPEEKKNDDIS